MIAHSAIPKDVDPQLRINWLSLDDWTKNQLLGIFEFCHSHNWELCHISDELSRVLPPVVAIWQVTFKSHHKLKTAWIISGDLPQDIVSFQNLPTARDAIFSFSKKYLKRAQILKSKASDVCTSIEKQAKEKELLEKLVKTSADLLVLYHEDEIWQE